MKRITLLLLILLGLSYPGTAQIPERPNPPRLVNDFAGILAANELNQLENTLVQFTRETSTQIVVVTMKDLEGNEPNDFATSLGEEWGVGQEGKDNGLVVLLKPKTQDSRGQVYISPGYGLEGVLPDALINRSVVQNEMIPRFQQNDYFGGLVSGLNVIMDITRGEYTAEQYQESVDQKGGSPFVFLIVLFIILISIFGRGRRRRSYSPGRSLPFWIAMGMMTGSGRSRGSFNNFSSGSGGFGGFGGFGGGSFGGGGAGGSW